MTMPPDPFAGTEGPDPLVINDIDVSNYKLVLLLDKDGILSLRRNELTKAELLEWLVRIRDAVLTGKGAIR